MDVGHHVRVASIAGSAAVSEQPRGTTRATRAGIYSRCNPYVALPPEVETRRSPPGGFRSALRVRTTGRTVVIETGFRSRGKGYIVSGKGYIGIGNSAILKRRSEPQSAFRVNQTPQQVGKVCRLKSQPKILLVISGSWPKSDGRKQRPRIASKVRKGHLSPAGLRFASGRQATIKKLPQPRRWPEQ